MDSHELQAARQRAWVQAIRIAFYQLALACQGPQLVRWLRRVDTRHEDELPSVTAMEMLQRHCGDDALERVDHLARWIQYRLYWQAFKVRLAEWLPKRHPSGWR